MPKRNNADPSAAENGTVGVAPRPPFLEALDGDARDEATGEQGRTMHQILVEAGAQVDRNGTYYRIVVDPAKPKQVVIRDGKRFLASETIRRDVAVGNSPLEASRAAIAGRGLVDSFWPGIGWLRGGVKAETEHPNNLGVLAQTTSGRVVLEEIEDDTAEVSQAIALKNVMQATAPATPAPAAPPLVSVVDGEEDN